MAPDTLTIIHFGDIHFWRIGWPLLDLWPKRALGMANLILKRRHRFPPRAGELVLERIAAEEADYVMFSGDLTTTALEAEFKAAARAFAPLLSKWHDRVFIIPGNHDRYTPRATRRRLLECAFTHVPPEYPLYAELNQHWALVAIDAAQPHLVTSRGRVDGGQLAKLEKLLAAAQHAGRHVIAMCHYPVAYPPGRKASAEHALVGREQLHDLLVRYGTRVLLHGHMHQRWRFETECLTHLNCGSAGMAVDREGCQAGFLKFELSPEGLDSVTAHWLDVTQLPEMLWRSAELPPTAT